MGRKEALFLSPLYLSDICGHGSLGGQLGAAFCTAASQNLAAVGRRHSLSKAMNLGSVTLSGLIGTNSCHIRKHLLLKYAQQLLSQPQRMDTVRGANAVRLILYCIVRQYVNLFFPFFKLVVRPCRSHKMWGFLPKTGEKKCCKVSICVVKYIFGL